MDLYTIALFGEAEKGDFRTAYYCRSLDQLVEYVGNPPEESRGLFYAVQALLYKHNLIFFRVKEEGFSSQDYINGLKCLESQHLLSKISAICIPGVGDFEIIDAMTPLCKAYHNFLITTESDLFDYLTDSRRH
jgi:hypothetical protein